MLTSSPNPSFRNTATPHAPIPAVPVTTVFDFGCYREFLRKCLVAHPVRRRPMSLNLWVKRLGYRSPRTIAMILNGTRDPSDKLCEAFCKDLQLSGQAKRYFELLVKQDKLRKQGSDCSGIERELQALGAGAVSPTIMSERLERFASDWYVLVVHLMVAAPDFVEDAVAMSRRLRSKVTPAQIRLAISDLLALGMLRREAGTGRLLHTSDQPLFSSTDIPRHAVRAHHRQMLERAAEAIEEQSVDEREFMSTNMAVRRSDIPAIKAFMRETRDRFYQQFEAHGADDVVQWNQQMFFHTTPLTASKEQPATNHKSEVPLQ